MSIAAPVLWVAPALRGGGGSTGQFRLKALNFTHSWGAQPATAVLNYVRETVADESIRTFGVAVGSYLKIEYAGRTFHGVCKSDNTVDASDGKERIIQFEDLRRYLAWDYIFGAWNLTEATTATDPSTGRPARVKRFRHLLPLNFERGIWTWTARPYTAAEILNFVFGLPAGGGWSIAPAPTLGTIWTRQYHPDQLNYPVLRIDAREGKRLDALLSEISARQGLVFTADDYLTLRWCRKGELLAGETVAPGGFDVLGNYEFPANTDQCRVGYAASEQPTRVLVVGGENVYQLLNVALTPDWASGWTYFMGDTERFVDYIYRNWTDPTTGKKYDEFDDDPEHLIGYYTARSRAQQLTLREFAAHEDTLIPPTGEPFRDYRKFAGRARLDMPCMLYLDQVVFRAFRPPSALPIWGTTVPTASMRLVDGMLASVNHDEVTGLMTPDLTAPLDGNGYAVIQGYMILDDIFDGVRADRFRLDRWVAIQSLWKKASFTVDDSGDGTQFVLFDAPIIRSENLVEQKDGYAVFRADATIEAAPVLASLTFLAERFIWRSQNDPATLDLTVNEPDLRREIVYDVTSGAWAEIPYADGQSAQYKAAVLGAVALARQFVVMQGGYHRWFTAGDVATRLSGFYDRVTLHYGPDGHYEDVDFANERGRSAFEPERDYDRELAQRAQFPGQAQLRARQELDELTAAGLKQSRPFYKSLTEAFRRFIGSRDAVSSVQLEDAEGEPTPLSVGTPLWRSAMPVAGGSNTLVKAPAATTTAHNVFAGVVTREAEPSNANLYVQTTGRLLARVKGPVAVRDTVAQSAGHDYLEAGNGTAPEVGMALQAVPDTSVRLILVQTGGTGSGRVVARWA